MNDDVVIKVEGVSKKYCRTIKHTMLYGATDLAKSFLGMDQRSERLRDGEFWALDNITFELKKGETLGIIGANGSGKSTLLKMLNGIFMPDRGKIEINGKVGALIEVGAGFHPMLTGRENIYINGAILGMTKDEIDRKFDEIVDFADIGEFIDSPVKHYSSGMYVRLGFAIAVHCEPEILLIDEVLSVGDLSFRNKSLRYMTDFRKKAKALIFISHNLEQVRVLCSRVIILDKGRIIYEGDVHQGIVKYEELSRKIRMVSIKGEQTIIEDKKFKGRISSNDEIEIIEVGILDSNGARTNEIGMNEPIKIYCDFKVNRFLDSLYFSAGVLNEELKPSIWVMSNDNNKVTFKDIEEGMHRLVITIPEHHLIPSVYIPNIAIRNDETGETYEKVLPNCSFRILSDGVYLERGIVAVKEQWDLLKKSGEDG